MKHFVYYGCYLLDNIYVRKVRKYQRGNQKPQTEEGQTTPDNYQIKTDTHTHTHTHKPCILANDKRNTVLNIT